MSTPLAGPSRGGGAAGAQPLAPGAPAPTASAAPGAHPAPGVVDPYPGTHAPAGRSVPIAGDDRRHRKAPLAWLPWAALAALIGLLALSLLIGAALRSGGDDAAPTGDPGAAGQSGGSGSGAAAGDAGTFRVGETDVLAGGQLADLSGLTGQNAVLRGVTVESVVADEGFWVGSSAEQRTFVFLTPEARQSAGESGFQVEAGQRVDLNGIVESGDAAAAERFGVTEQEGAAQLAEQGAYVRALQVRLTS